MGVRFPELIRGRGVTFAKAVKVAGKAHGG